MRTGIVGGEERADDELSRLNRLDRAADLFDEAAILVSHRCQPGRGLQATIRPKVRPAYAGRRYPDDGVRWSQDFWLGAVLETDSRGSGRADLFSVSARNDAAQHSSKDQGQKRRARHRGLSLP